jgi:glycosyltransferase 2 family protein
LKLFKNYMVSIAVGCVFLWLAFQGEDWGQFSLHLQNVSLTGVVGYVVLFAFAHALRIVRWGILVSALGQVERLKVFAIGAVGYMAIMVLPFRLGEFVRPYLIRGEAGITASGALATVVVERIIDGLIFVALFFLFLSILPPSGNPAVDALRYAAYLAGMVFGGALIVLIAGFYGRAQTIRITRRLMFPLPDVLVDKLVGLLEAFLDGLVVLPDLRRLGSFLLMTFVYWGALGVGMLVMANAVGIEGVTWVGGFALLTVLTVGIMIPAGPGFTGTFELALQAGFALLIIPDDSLALISVYAVVLHVSQLFVQVGFGVLFLNRAPIQIKSIFGTSPEKDE